MHALDVAVWVCGLVGGELGEHFGGLKRQQELGHILGAALQHAQRGADATGDGEFDHGLQLGRAGDADMDGQGDARFVEAISQAMIGAASNANCVARAILASVRSENCCFH